MSRTVGIDQLDEAIAKELTLYGENVMSGIKKKSAESIKKLVKETKATAPVGKRKKHYRDSIKSKKTKDSYRDISYVWYVDGSDYRLSHLLENGHALRNGGRTRGTHFIKKASDPILEDYVKAVEEIIKNG